MIKRFNFSLVSLSAVSLVLGLSACGGGGGGVGGGNTSVAISGVAAIGAPLPGASIRATSLSSDCEFFAQTQTGDDGSFSFNADTNTCPGPYLLRISGGRGVSGNEYAFVDLTATSTGLVVSPFSTAAVALAKSSAPDDAVFNSQLNAQRYAQAVSVVFNSAADLFTSLGIDSYSTLVNNVNFVADGSGADRSLELLKVETTESGSVLIGSKFGGAAVELGNLQATSRISSLNTSLASDIYTELNENMRCADRAFQSGSSEIFISCVVPGDAFMHEGKNAGLFFDEVLGYLSEAGVTSLRALPATLNWCLFDNPSNNLSQTNTQLAGATGRCHAQLNWLTNDSPISFGMYFRLDVSDQGVVSVAALGNQVDYFYEVTPAIERKIRVDGLTGNDEISSGYKFDVDTGQDRLPNGEEFISENSSRGVLSATVELTDSLGNRLPGGLIYLQCQQGNICYDSTLSICTDKTCATKDLSSAAIVRTDSTLAQAIVQARQLGPVYFEITAYGKLNQEGDPRYRVREPLTGLPVAQEEAEGLQFPLLTDVSVAAIASWAGENELDLTLNASEQIHSSYVNFGAPNRSSASLTLSPDSGQIPFTLSGMETSEITALDPGCAGSETPYRALYLEASYRSVPVTVKYFGSCSPGDY